MKKMATDEQSPPIPASVCEWRPELSPAAPTIDPFFCANGGCDPLLRSLEVSPYSFLTPGWLARNSRAFVLCTRAFKAFKGANAAKKKVSVAINLRMQLPHRAELWPNTSVVLRESEVPADDDVPLAIVTLVFRILPEAIFARQLHSREFCVGGGALLGFEEQREFDRSFFDQQQWSPAERAQLATLARVFGDKKAAAVFSALHRAHPNTLAHLVAQCRHAPPGISGYFVKRVPKVEKEEPAEVEAVARGGDEADDSEGWGESEGSGETLGSETTESGDGSERADDDDDERRARDSYGSNDASDESSGGGAQVCLEGDIPDDLLSFMREPVDSSDGEEAAAEMEEAEMEEDGVEEEGAEVEQVLCQIHAKDKGAPAPRDFSDHRTNELAWMQLAVQKRAVELVFQLTFLGSVDSARARAQRFVVDSAVVPFEIGANSSEHLPLLVTSAERLSVAKAAPTLFFYSEHSEAGAVETAPDAKVKEPEAEPAVTAVVQAPSSRLAQPRSLSTTLIGRLARIDIGAFTIAELELYGLRRLEALFSLALHGERPLLYSNHSGLSKRQREQIGGQAGVREYWYQTAGLFVLCCASKRDTKLLRSLCLLERAWCEEDVAAHCRDILRFCAELPAEFEGDEETLEPAELAFVRLLDTVARRWFEFISSQ